MAEVRIGITTTGGPAAARALTDVGDAADKSAAKMANAADRTDELDSKASAATGSLGALSSGFELVGLDKYAAGLQGAALATDFFSGVGQAGTLILQSATLAKVKDTVATAAHATAQFTAGTAAKAWAATQWLLNAALTANPIGLVVVAIAALVAGFILAWKRSETFRDIVKGGMEVARDAIGWVVDKGKDLVQFFTGLPGKMKGLFVGLFDGIKDAFRGAINFVIRGWNSLKFSIPSIDTHIPGVGKVGGFTVGVPQIPELATGGIVTGPTLALIGEAGPEAVVPLDRLAAGPSVVRVHLTADALDQLARGRSIASDLKAWNDAGGTLALT